MAQQLTVVLIVDVPAALDAGTLDGNIYLVDDLKTQGSENEGTGKLISAVNGSHWFNYQQASAQLINWLPYSITCLSPNLPRFYAEDRLAQAQQRVLQMFRPAALLKANATSGEADAPVLQAAAQAVSAVSAVFNQQGQTVANNVALMDVRGNFLSADNVAPLLLQAGSSVQQEEQPVRLEDLSYLAPQIYNITGEAVDKGVIYPAQYGSPSPVKGGWYWCASVNTAITGIYTYTLHITLYKPEITPEGVVWLPVDFTYDARINVTSGAMQNGFTNAGVGFLPIL
jgi:hypothetical protein